MRYISRNGLQRNFNVQGIMMIEVQKAICVSDMPKSLNMNVETRLTAMKRQPHGKINGRHPGNRVTVIIVIHN